MTTAGKGPDDRPGKPPGGGYEMTRSIYCPCRRESEPTAVARRSEAASHRTPAIASVPLIDRATLVTSPTATPSLGSGVPAVIAVSERTRATRAEDVEVPDLGDGFLAEEAAFGEVDRSLEPRFRRGGHQLRNRPSSARPLDVCGRSPGPSSVTSTRPSSRRLVRVFSVESPGATTRSRPAPSTDSFRTSRRRHGSRRTRGRGRRRSPIGRCVFHHDVGGEHV